MKKSILGVAVILLSLSASAQESSPSSPSQPTALGPILSNKINECENIFPLNSYVQLTAGNETELKTNQQLKKQIESLIATGRLVPRENLTQQKAMCVAFAEGLLAGRMIYQTTSELAAGIAKGLEKAVQSIK
jgi:hypothetical protein